MEPLAESNKLLAVADQLVALLQTVLINQSQQITLLQILVQGLTSPKEGA